MVNKSINHTSFKSIAIAGIGLIGGSLAKSFANNGLTLYAFDTNSETINLAKASGIFKDATSSLSTLLSFDPDLLYIALPVEASIALILELKKVGYKGKVIDAASTKSSIMKAAKGLFFCGGHPIRGKELSGFENSEAGLFNGAIEILTIQNNKSKSYKAFIDELTILHRDILNMKVKVMTAKMHDNTFASISHLPHLISFCLMQAVIDDDESFLSYAGGGFRDFTRIAASDATMWQNIFFDNKKAILSKLNHLKRVINDWQRLIKDNKTEEIHQKISRVSKKRKEIK